MLIRIRTPIKMYRININYDTDTFGDIKKQLTKLMDTNIDDIIISKDRKYDDIFLNKEKVSSISISQGHIFYAKTLSSKKIVKQDIKLSNIKKKWTFQDLKTYETKNTHIIGVRDSVIKTVFIDKNLLNGFIQTCKDKKTMLYADLYGIVDKSTSHVKTMFIPEQISTEDTSLINIDRDRFYKNTKNTIIKTLGFQLIGKITYFINDTIKTTENVLSMINRQSKNPNSISLICEMDKGEISVSAIQINSNTVELYNKNIVYVKHSDKTTMTIKPTHTIMIKSNKITDCIDVELLISPIPIKHKNGPYRVHDLTFLNGWKPKRIYNFKKFRSFMKRNCPTQDCIKYYIYDISFLIFIKQWFNDRDYKLLLECIRNQKITPGFKLIICGISNIK